MKEKKRKAPPVLTGYDPRAVERAPKFADGHLPQGKIPHAVGADAHIRPQNPPVEADDSVRPENNISASSPKAPDGISGDWQ